MKQVQNSMGGGKLAGFTLIEMLMVLALSGIVVTVAWSVFSNFNLFGLEFRKRNADAFELLLLDAALRSDVAVSEAVTGDSLALQFSGPAEVQYRFSAPFVVRKEAATIDTFWVSCSQIDLNREVNRTVIRFKMDALGKRGTMRYSLSHPPTARKGDRRGGDSLQIAKDVNDE